VADQAFVTLGTDDVYCQGALVLGQSLRNHMTSRKLAILITPQVSSVMRAVLCSVFDEVIEVDAIDSADSMHLALLERPELGVTFTKLHCWTLTQYSKCVFMDADTLVLCNIDELFEREELSAAPDSGWPDCFNSGVFVFRPSVETYNRLLQFATEHGSFDGGDQGLLNSFFSNWATTDIGKHLPFIYNLSTSAIYTYVPAFKHFGRDAKVVHFLGSAKPWHYKYNSQTRTIMQDGSTSGSQHQYSFLVLWWKIYYASILPLLETLPEMEDMESQGQKAFDLDNILLNLVLVLEFHAGFQNKFKSHHENLELEEPNAEEERKKWEEGRMDYMGKDAFEHIKKKLDTFLK
uniref:glycogenin glucosyltransferase n=1 Tax=Gopherus evgoodei TaxID=1825980 RepID=A0A8C4VPE9_9SAUR